jgi:hypothetical protein
MVPEKKEQSLGVRYSELIPILIKVIREQKEQIEALKQSSH